MSSSSGQQKLTTKMHDAATSDKVPDTCTPGNLVVDKILLARRVYAPDGVYVGHNVQNAQGASDYDAATEVYSLKADADRNLTLKDGEQQILKYIRSTKTLELGAGNVAVRTGKSQGEHLETVRQRSISNEYAWQNNANLIHNNNIAIQENKNLMRVFSLTTLPSSAPNGSLAVVTDGNGELPALAYYYSGKWYRASDNTTIP